VPETNPDSRTVNPELLKAILGALEDVRYDYITNFDKHQRDKTLKILPLVQAKCSTLRKIPQHFADMESYDIFFSTIDRYTTQIMEVIRMNRAKARSEEVNGKWGRAASLQRERPALVSELATQPWQQYLHAESPGWPVELVPSSTLISRQRIPNGGVRILEAWESQARDVYAFLDAVSFELRLLLTSPY
jgi:hypothetical protein